MSGRTAGPWTIGREPNGAIKILCGCHKRALAGLYFTGHPGQTEGDARLIAAAPELLEALKACQVRIMMQEGNQGDTYKQADAAISKAEGRE